MIEIKITQGAFKPPFILECKEVSRGITQKERSEILLEMELSMNMSRTLRCHISAPDMGPSKTVLQRLTEGIRQLRGPR